MNSNTLPGSIKRTATLLVIALAALTSTLATAQEQQQAPGAGAVAAARSAGFTRTPSLRTGSRVIPSSGT